MVKEEKKGGSMDQREAQHGSATAWLCSAATGADTPNLQLDLLLVQLNGADLKVNACRSEPREMRDPTLPSKYSNLAIRCDKKGGR